MVSEGIIVAGPVVRLLDLARQFAQTAVFTGRLLVHAGFGSCRRQCVFQVHVFKEKPYLLIGYHPSRPGDSAVTKDLDYGNTPRASTGINECRPGIMNVANHAP